MNIEWTGRASRHETPSQNSNFYIHILSDTTAKSAHTMIRVMIKGPDRVNWVTTRGTINRLDSRNPRTWTLLHVWHEHNNASCHALSCFMPGSRPKLQFPHHKQPFRNNYYFHVQRWGADLTWIFNNCLASQDLVGIHRFI